MSKNNETQQSCAIYCRFSSKQQEGNFSIEAQKSACLEYAHKQNWKVYRIFEDRALSGTSDERDSFQEMIRQATTSPPPFQAILVHKLDRFARNRYDSVKYKYLLRKQGVKVISATQPMVGSNDPTEILVESLLEGMDEFYSLNLARETIKGMVEAAKQGYWCHGLPPYGYRKNYIEQNGKRRAKLEIDPKESNIVEYIYKRYARANIGIKGLTIELNNKRIHPRTGKYFTKGHIEHILGSEKYAGDMIFGKELNTGNRQFKSLQEPVVVKNSHPAIISRNLDAKVKNILKLRNPENSPPRIHNDSYLLSSLIICGRCGARYVGASGKSGKYHYYICGTKNRKGKIACNAPEYNRAKLEGQVIEKIQKYILTEKNIQELAVNLFKVIKDVAPDLGKKVARVQAEIRQKNNKLQRLYEILETSNDLNADDLAPRMRELKTDIQILEGQKEILDSEIKQVGEAQLNTRWIKAYARLLIDLLESKDFYTRKNFLARMVEKIEVKDKEFKISFRPFVDPDSLPVKKNSGALKTPEFSQKKYWLPLVGENQNSYLISQNKVFVYKFTLA
ncbi:MAG: recombinase family protein [Candidatus Omnitrophica bacterium]|nr:recombinase family protein [Candidatus Omnitrophota bacterium]